MIDDIRNIVIKNFKIIFRAKMSIFVMVVAPILIVFLLGFAFNASTAYYINIGIYSGEYSQLTNTFIYKLTEKKFNVLRETTELNCVNHVKEGNTNICVVFPPGMEIKAGKTNNIVFHVDPSGVNLVWMILETISSNLAQRTEEITLNLTSGLLNILRETSQKVSDNKYIVDELKQENLELQEISSSVNNILKLTIDLNNIRVPQIENLNDNNKKNVTEFTSYLKSKINVMQRDAKEAEDNLNLLGNISTTRKRAITDALSSIKNKLDSLDASVDNLASGTDDDWEQLSMIIVDLKTLTSGLNKAKEQMKHENLLLNQSSGKIVLLSEIFNQIYNNVNSMQITDADNIVNPITTTIKPIVAKKSHLNYIFAGLIILIIMFVSILLASTIVLMEKKSKSYLLNYLTPTKDLAFVLSTYFTIMIMMVFQLTIILGISAYFYQAQVLPNLGVVSLILLVSTTVFVLVGMCIAYIFKEEQTITLITVAVGNIFLFLSDIILPLESMPQYVQKIVWFNPFLIAERILKRSILFDARINDVSSEIWLLVGYCVVIFVVILMVEKLIKRHTLAKFFRKIFPFKR